MRSFLRPAFLSAILVAALLPAAAESVYHVLETGETVYALARRYHVSADAILAANGVADPARLKAGTRLLIPTTHTVLKGETLFGIARDHGISLDELRKANGLGGSSAIKAGDILFLPIPLVAGSAAAGSAPVTSPATTSATSSATTSASTLPATTASGGVLPLPVSAAPGKAADPRATWPATGDTRYLEGKLRGVLIQAPAGSPVKAVSSGTVVSAGAYRGYGLVAFVEGRGGHIYVYGGLETLVVAAGDPVSPGILLGKVGMDRASGVPAAYFFVFKDGSALDPASAPRG